MARLVGIDYGLKRVGLAVTDPLQIIATPLGTVPTDGIFTFLEDYFGKEKVEGVVIGLPADLLGRDTDGTAPVREFIERFGQKWPDMPILTADERYTSKMAARSMVEGGIRKKERQKKSNLDKISATIILQQYLETQRI